MLKSFFGSGDSNKGNDSTKYRKRLLAPTIRVRTDKEVYRPGDSVLVTIEITNPNKATEGFQPLLLIEKLGFEMKGIEKMDAQWFVTQKPLPGSRQRRGEYVFMECSTSSMVSNHVVSFDSTKTYVVRAVFPSIIPPSYKGATIRYLYYVKSALFARWLIMENPDSHGEPMQDLVELESRLPLQIWVTQKNNGLLVEEDQNDGIVPATTVQLDMYWKDMDGDSEWARANEVDDGVEEGYDSSRDEISSVSSFNLTKESLRRTFSSSLSLQSSVSRASFKDAPYAELGRASLSPTQALRLSAAEILHDSVADTSPNKSLAIVSPSHQKEIMKTHFEDYSADASSAPVAEASKPSPCKISELWLLHILITSTLDIYPYIYFTFLLKTS